MPSAIEWVGLALLGLYFGGLLGWTVWSICTLDVDRLTPEQRQAWAEMQHAQDLEEDRW